MRSSAASPITTASAQQPTTDGVLARGVLVGSGMGVFLNDLWEMLTLFVACITFVITTLALERASQDSAKDNTTTGEPTEAHKP